MRVAHLVNNYDWVGGIETYVLNLVPLLQDRGIVQTIVCGRVGNSVTPVSTIEYNPARIDHTKNQIKNFTPDLVHVHNIFDLNLLQYLLDHYPVIFTTHGYQLICPAQDFYLERPREICTSSVGPSCALTTLTSRCMSLRPKHALRTYRLARWALKNSSTIAHLISPCSYTRDRYCEAGFDTKAISVVPYFCATQPLNRPRPEPRSPTITFLGRITAYKGADLFVEALAALSQEVRGLLIGNLNTKNRQWLEMLARQRGVAGRLELRDWVSRDQIGQVFNETSIFVFPSIWPETLGIVGLEALSCGVPVVSFDVAGAKEWCLNGETGFRVEIKNVRELVRAIELLLEDRGLAGQMGHNGIDLINKRFSPEVHINSLTRIYSKVAV